MYTIGSEQHSEQSPSAQTEEETATDSDSTTSKSCYVQRTRTTNAMTVIFSYARDLVLFCLLFILTAYATYQNTPLKVARAPPPTSFFQNTSVIEDFTTGKLVPTQNNVALSEISLVLYYAPWCAESRSVRKVYENVAREFKNQVYFAAINCWEPRGECRIQYANVPSWPTLMAYRSNGIGIQYNGIWKEEALSRFIQSLMHPIVRLETLDDLINLSTTGSVVVAAFLDISQNVTAFRHFYQTALKFLELDPTRDLVFAICLGKNVRSYGLDSRPRLRIHIGDKILEYRNTTHWLQFDMVHWIKQAVKVVSEWATPLGLKANDIGLRFQERAALIVFTPRSFTEKQSNIVDLIKQFGYSYRNCNNDTWLMRLNHNYVRQLRDGHLQPYSSLYSTSCSSNDDLEPSTFGLYRDPSEEINTCSKPQAIDDEYFNALNSVQGYACLNHKNLSIVFIDSTEYSIFADKYGPRVPESERNQTRILLFDAEDEKVFLLNEFTPQSISNFIRDYTDGNLQHFKKSMYSLPTVFAEVPKKDDGAFYIREITSRQFEAHVMSNNKTTFVLFHSSFCTFCQTMSYYLLNVARHFSKVPAVDFFRIDVDKNDLDDKYSVSNLPTLAVFPAHRKNEIRIFPWQQEVNTANMISFIFSNIPKSIRLHVLMTLCNNDMKMKKNLNGSFCAATLRKEVSSNISQALKNWSSARNSTQRTFESRKIYHLKRMYLQLLNHNVNSLHAVEKELMGFSSL